MTIRSHWADHEYQTDLDTAGARQKAAKQPGATGARTNAAEALTPSQRPDDDTIRAQQWAHLRKYYVQGES